MLRLKRMIQIPGMALKMLMIRKSESTAAKMK